jgi:hypothetical protein
LEFKFTVPFSARETAVCSPFFACDEASRPGAQYVAAFQFFNGGFSAPAGCAETLATDSDQAIRSLTKSSFFVSDKKLPFTAEQAIEK